MRRQWVHKGLPTVRRVSEREVIVAITDHYHRHGCNRCSHTYEDACDTPLVNGLCTACRGRTPPLWELSLDEHECCSGATPATLQERTTYRLGGDAEWFLCHVCYRPFIYTPTGKEAS